MQHFDDSPIRQFGHRFHIEAWHRANLPIRFTTQLKTFEALAADTAQMKIDATLQPI
ncbi:hypothetical protein X756_04225 [Mesorhizobium sp. LSHC412B00]|nr:hypothetical protein X756_04225 [Mesorhizobium sp. LSHC412B00]